MGIAVKLQLNRTAYYYPVSSFSPLATALGLVIPVTNTLIVILFLVIAFTFSTDILKRMFFRSFKTNS